MAETKPIPIRLDEAMVETLRTLSERSDTAQADIIRRAVQFALDTAETTGRVDFLFDKNARATLIAEIKNLGAHHMPLAAEEPVSYKASPDSKQTAKKRTGAA